ncbi:hypothetical protein I0Q91_06545 [Halanaerobiaceae bacterium Z-7014]|uniref:Uncharacterized protein n=1 Tax=Halonatronomonas betaini TaxID=2778430 RepID=A0A931AV60_9FIRM|nr:hypothetical protein [Halonatronomonas betaini]MBF8436726.1 hypothetical protein [Halonatronomonas betaini]
MLKKATVLLIVFTLIVSFSMTSFASNSNDIVQFENGERVIYNPAEPEANGYSGSGNGHGPNNPLYVAGE